MYFTTSAPDVIISRIRFSRQFRKGGKMLSVRNITKSFGANRILDGIDLDVDKGDVTVILGPSGSGKTTLLRCMDFLETPDSGTMDYDDIHIDYTDVRKKEILKVRRKTGFVFQNYNLFSNKTALQNVTEGLITVWKRDRREAESIAKEALDKVGLKDLYERYPSALSGGQCQRVGIARAIAFSPEIIFFDEPTSALDPELVGGILAILKQLAREDTTMVIVTHEMSFASEAANHVIFMENGKIIEQGPPDRVFRHPEMERTRQFLRLITKDYDYSI